MKRLLARGFCLALAAAAVPAAVRAANLDGVHMPSTLQVNGETLHLNGLGLRTYSIFGIHIYVAGLYLAQVSSDAQAILQSPETKLLTLQFERGVSADSARAAWRDGLTNNCQPPCHVSASDVDHFLAEIPAVRAGDSYSFFFAGHGVSVIADGKQLGRIDQPDFAEAILAMFLGPAPASPALKAELLQPRASRPRG